MSNEDICQGVTFSLLDFIDNGDWVDRYMNAKGVTDKGLISGALIFVTELFTYGKSTTQESCIERAEKIEAAKKAIEADSGFSQTVIHDSRKLIAGDNPLAPRDLGELTLNYHAEMLFSLSWLAMAYRGRAEFISLIPRKDTTIYYLVGLVFSRSDTEPSIPLPTITQAIELATFIASTARKSGIQVREPVAEHPTVSRQMRAGVKAGVALSSRKSKVTSNWRLPGVIIQE